MLDRVRIEAAEKQLNNLLDRAAAKVKEDRPGQDAANLEAARLRAEDRRKAEELRQQNRLLWISHYRRLAFASLKDARDYRRRARRLEQGETA